MHAAQNHETNKQGPEAAGRPLKCGGLGCGRQPRVNPLWQRLTTQVDGPAGAMAVGRLPQAKLTIGAPGDHYEREADRIADRVINIPAPAIQAKPTRPLAKGSPWGDEDAPVQSKVFAGPITSLIQLQSEIEEEEEEESVQASIVPGARVQRQAGSEEEEEEETVQAQASGQGGPVSGRSNQMSPEGRSAGLRPVPGSGQPLAPSARRFFEPRFGTDFGGVRVHTGARSHRAAGGINARAYTLGRHIVFGTNQYQPGTPSGRRLLAHELTHTLQQGAVPVGARTASQRQPAIQCYSWDEFKSDAASVGGSVVEGVSSAGEALVGAGETTVEALGAAGEAIVETAGEAVDWITSAAGQAALQSANALAVLFGGSVVIRRGCLIVTIPEIPLFPSFQKTLAATPPYGIYIPFLAGGTMVGPFPVAGTFGFLAYGQLSAEAALGPGVLRGISVEICPLAGHYMGTAQLYIAAAIAPRLTLFAGLAAGGATIIPFDPPIPVVVILQGGLRATGTGWLIGALRDTVTVLYSGGRLNFSNVAELMGGVLLQGDLDLFAALRLYHEIICQYVHPLGHWEAGRAMQLTVPVNASLGRGGAGAGVGPVTWGAIPITDIETVIRPLASGWSCVGWDKIKKILCDNGLLPEVLCEDEEEGEDGENEVLRNQIALGICKCVGDDECGAGYYYRCFMVSDKVCNNPGELNRQAQHRCNNTQEMKELCRRPRCYIRHVDSVCPVNEDRCDDWFEDLIAAPDHHDPSPRVPMLPDDVARRAQALMDRENYAAALEVVVSGLRLNLNLCYFTHVNRTDAGEGLTTTDYSLDPDTGNYVPDGPSRVEIYSPAFATLPWLVSTIMHEYQHVLQAQRHLTPEEMEDPAGEHEEADEVEAYLWEIENVGRTGMVADVFRIQETGARLTEHYNRLGQINPLRQAQYMTRYKAAMQFIADLATGPPPLPGYPHVYHHGTDYDTARIVYLSDIEARGRVDFGAGFYTHTKENWQLAKEWALRKAVGEHQRGWGVVTFPIPTPLWNAMITSSLIYRDQNDMPVNAPINPDTGRRMGWREFVRYNFRKEQEGSLPSWSEYNVLRGPLYGSLAGTDIRQVMFTSSGTPLLNMPEVKSLRIPVIKLFRRRRR